MTANDDDTAQQPQPEPLLWDHPDRELFRGLNVVNRATGDIDSIITFTNGELDMPGYVEHVEKGYLETPWRTERTWDPERTS